MSLKWEVKIKGTNIKYEPYLHIGEEYVNWSVSANLPEYDSSKYELYVLDKGRLFKKVDLGWKLWTSDFKPC